MAHKVQGYHCSKSRGNSGNLNCIPLILHAIYPVLDAGLALYYYTLYYTTQSRNFTPPRGGVHPKCWI